MVRLYLLVKILESDMKIDDQFVEEINSSLNHNKYLSNKKLAVIDKIDKIEEEIEEENKEKDEINEEVDNLN